MKLNLHKLLQYLFLRYLYTGFLSIPTLKQSRLKIANLTQFNYIHQSGGSIEYMHLSSGEHGSGYTPLCWRA